MDEPLDNPGEAPRDAELPKNGIAEGREAGSTSPPEGPSDVVEPPKDDMEDRAALAVMLYLLFISTLLVLAIVICFFVVAQYGVVIFVAMCLAAFAFAVVAATVVSVITADAKLEKARSQIHRWHVTCKEEILREIDNFREDYAAYSSGVKLIAYYDDGGLDYVDEGMDDQSQGAEQRTTADDAAETPRDDMHTTNKREHRPKSMLFRYVVAPFTKGARPRRKPRLSMRRKKRDADAGSYRPPNLV